MNRVVESKEGSSGQQRVRKASELFFLFPFVKLFVFEELH